MQGHVFPASDLYSLGVTCVRLLTGCLPYEKNGTLVDEIFNPMSMTEFDRAASPPLQGSG